VFQGEVAEGCGVQRISIGVGEMVGVEVGVRVGAGVSDGVGVLVGGEVGVGVAGRERPGRHRSPRGRALARPPAKAPATDV